MIATPRISLRLLTPDDAAFLLELLNSPGWLQNIGDRGVKTIAAAQAYASERIIKGYTENGFGLYVMALKGQDDIPIGLCGLIRRPGLEDVDIGFALLPQYMGQGYAFEAASAVMDHARNSLKIPRIVAITLPTNSASIKLLEKIGLRFERMANLPNDPEELMLYGSNL
ncbi:MAG: GNAT family N-acetyltransferase [Phaeodactylibacter sp.]|nr:GNAT family N-acetyltransferase [Phaeodactylibacter sp.]